MQQPGQQGAGVEATNTFQRELMTTLMADTLCPFDETRNECIAHASQGLFEIHGNEPAALSLKWTLRRRGVSVSQRIAAYRSVSQRIAAYRSVSQITRFMLQNLDVATEKAHETKKNAANLCNRTAEVRGSIPLSSTTATAEFRHFPEAARVAYGKVRKRARAKHWSRRTMPRRTSAKIDEKQLVARVREI